MTTTPDVGAGFCKGDRADLSYAYDSTPQGRTVELLSTPDEDGMVRVRLTGDFKVSVDDLRHRKPASAGSAPLPDPVYLAQERGEAPDVSWRVVSPEEQR